jgi:hypothetical protein
MEQDLVTAEQQRADVCDNWCYCPHHPRHACDAMIAAWRASDDPARRACASELASAVDGGLFAWAPGELNPA